MSIRISGAIGSNAVAVNGTYDPTEELSSGGCCIYQKRGDDDVWLELHSGKWIVKPTTSKGRGVGWASIACDGPKAPEKCGGTWSVCDGSGWIDQASIRVEVVPCLVSGLRVV